SRDNEPSLGWRLLVTRLLRKQVELTRRHARRRVRGAMQHDRATMDQVSAVAGTDHHLGRSGTAVMNDRIAATIADRDAPKAVRADDWRVGHGSAPTPRDADPIPASLSHCWTPPGTPA